MATVEELEREVAALREQLAARDLFIRQLLGEKAAAAPPAEPALPLLPIGCVRGKQAMCFCPACVMTCPNIFATIHGTYGCIDGYGHQYPGVWHGIVPPPCSKCGQAAVVSGPTVGHVVEMSAEASLANLVWSAERGLGPGVACAPPPLMPGAYTRFVCGGPPDRPVMPDDFVFGSGISNSGSVQ